MSRITAVATLPIEDPRVATAALRGRLQLTVTRQGGEPDWESLRVTGPRLYEDARGTRWFEWVATVEVQDPPAEVPPTPLPERPTVADLGILRRRAG